MDFYVILGVERGATVADVKRAYKRLARRYHPDINPGDRMAEAHFRQIAQAYETLIDPDRRRRYDATGTTDQTAPGPTVGFEGFDFTVSVHGSEASTFGDLFADVFRQRDQPPAETVNVALTCIRRSPSPSRMRSAAGLVPSRSRARSIAACAAAPAG